MSPEHLPAVPQSVRRAAAWRAWAGAALLALAACTAQPRLQQAPAQPPRPPPPSCPAPAPAPEHRPATAVDQPACTEATLPAPLALALQHADRVRSLDTAALQAEIARLEPAVQASSEPGLHLALALAQTRQPPDTARALGLVQEALDNGQAAALHSLARLLEARLLQQRRLEEQLSRVAHQLRDAQRRNAQLTRQLEAVRALERSMNARPARAGPKRPAAPADSP